MIRVTFLYPNTEGSRFDLDYYINIHCEMSKARLGAALKGYSVERGISGIEPGAKAPYHAIGQLLFDSVESFYEAIIPHVEELKGDVANYSDNEAIIQISEVEMSSND